MNRNVLPAMKYRWILSFATAGVFVVSMFVLAGCSDEAPTETDRRQTVNFELEDLEEGETFKLSDYQGSVVLLQFFAVWCPRCQEETEILNTLHDEYNDEDLIVVTIPVQSGSREDVRDFVEEYDVEYRVLYDEKGIVAPAYGVRRTPTTYIIDREGWIAESFAGGMSEADFREVIEPLL